jgi:hypothetical protein
MKYALNGTVRITLYEAEPPSNLGRVGTANWPSHRCASVRSRLSLGKLGAQCCGLTKRRVVRITAALWIAGADLAVRITRAHGRVLLRQRLNRWFGQLQDGLHSPTSYLVSDSIRSSPQIPLRGSYVQFANGANRPPAKEEASGLQSRQR